MNSCLSSLAPQGCPAFLPRPLATMMQSISCQQHSTWGRRQNLTKTIKTTEIFVDPCDLHFFHPSRGFCSAEVTGLVYLMRHIKRRKRIYSISFLLVPKPPKLELDPFHLPLFLLGLQWNSSVLFQFSTTYSSKPCLPVFLQ